MRKVRGIWILGTAAAAPVAMIAAAAADGRIDADEQARILGSLKQAGVEAEAARAGRAALEATMLASIHKKGLGEFTLPGLLKITAQNVPAKKKRLGKDPFTGVERMFAAKPASTKIKTRALKKLKDAAL